jgi:hypothetical protein
LSFTISLRKGSLKRLYSDAPRSQASQGLGNSDLGEGEKRNLIVLGDELARNRFPFWADPQDGIEADQELITKSSLE